jgi:predicted RNA-binding Zn ribbon-like protein
MLVREIMVTDHTFLLDLLNTTPVVDGSPQDTLGRDWLRAHSGTGSAAELAATREARDLLQSVVHGADASVLGPLLEGVSRHATVGSDGIEWTLEVEAVRRPAVRAMLAWDELSRTSPGRLRPCANTECRLFLIDRSKPNNARWCSMAVCGNRMKARRHYQRTR